MRQAGTKSSPRRSFFQTKREIATESGRTYSFVIKNSERAKAMAGMAIVGGLAGALVAAAVTSKSDNPGPVDLYPLDEATAGTTLAGLQLAEWRAGRARRKIAGA